jgi:hypothetical protein
MEEKYFMVLCIVILIGVIGVCGVVVNPDNSKYAHINESTNNSNISNPTNNSSNFTNNTTSNITDSSNDNDSQVGLVSYDSEGNEYWTYQLENGSIVKTRNGPTSDGGFNHYGIHYDESGRKVSTAITE